MAKGGTKLFISLRGNHLLGSQNFPDFGNWGKKKCPYYLKRHFWENPANFCEKKLLARTNSTLIERIGMRYGALPASEVSALPNESVESPR